MPYLQRLWVFFSVLGLLTLVGCNFPKTTAAPTPFPFPTLDLTQTASYSSPATQSPAPTNRVEPGQPASSPAPPNTGATSTPAATDQVLNHRSNGHVTAAHLPAPPKIDGSLADWSLPSIPVNTVVFGSSQWRGESDLSGTLMAGWDQDNLYLAGHVKDDIYIQNSTGNDLYLGDSLEVLLDANLPGDFYVISLSPDDFQIGFSPGSPQVGDRPEVYRWYPKNLAGSLNDVSSAYQATGDGYDFELAIPWRVFETSPQSGMVYGFAFSISDNDLPGQNVQQSMVSTAPDRQLLNPTTWGDLTLSP